MALFNKLFTNRRNTHNKHQDNVSEKLFAFSKDQVRVVLFRECDFRGRKLLFDSNSVKKIAIVSGKTSTIVKDNEKIAEITDGFGYIYTRPEPDFNQLGEMVFGSVAMSFRGTYFKMHHLDQPHRLMFTQVFSSPRHATNNGPMSISSLEHSKLDDSGASSTNSMSEQLSVHSTTSDTILVCRHSTPLDVPNAAASIPSLVGDSGHSSSSGPSSVSTWGHTTTASNLSLASTRSRRKTSFSFGQSEGSVVRHHHHRNSKLGLAFILELDGNDALDHFLMEHVSLVESMVWRARHLVERACCNSHNFTSLMMDMTQMAAQYLVNLLSGPYLSLNLWLSLSNGCDNYNSIHAFNASSFLHPNKTYSIDEFNFSISGSSNNCSNDNNSAGSLHSSIDGSNLFNIGRFLKTDWDPFNIKKNFFGEQKTFTADKFVRDFCELLEIVDVKDTNFFMSTLLTAVLTHHLGWVNTCFPSEETSQQPYNPLWTELSDLYGAIGHPTKMAQTIITGTHRKDLVSKILVSLTYFIRCCDVEKRVPVRVNIDTDKEIVETLCKKQGSIPKENFKRYNDHLKEIMNVNQFNNNFQYKCEREKCREIGTVLKKTNGLQKTKTCLGNISDLNGDLGTKSENGLSRMATNTSLYKLTNSQKENLNPASDEESRDVVFVLGDSDQLVGLKKDKLPTPQRPTYLDLCQFQDKDFVENNGSIKHSTSWSTLNDPDTIPRQMNKTDCSSTGGSVSNKYPRSQSVPPEERKSDNDTKSQSKYRYCGVKFNLQQHPQILTNYMKSKNLEMTHLRFGEKGLKIDELSSLSETIKFPELNVDFEESEALQTPSNASELEFTSDLFETPQHAQETQHDSPMHHNVLKQQLPNTVIRNCSNLYNEEKMRVALLPMPQTKYIKPIFDPVKYTSTLMRAASDDYIPDMVLQAPNLPKQTWESKLKSDLALASQHSLLDQPIEEAVAVLANTDSWEVQVMSSHTFVIDKNSSGIRVGMSQLVSNMLESLLQMWKLNVSPYYCLMHIEQTLQELCIRSKALAELLLATEFCSMEQLTSTLQLEVNDVPLLLAVASTHSPQVTQKYGLSFQ